MSIESNIENRIIHFTEMVPCKTAFIDTKTPGSDQKENFCLIGEGVTENPDQIVHINIPHGFNVGAARQPKGCKNSHHSHDTEEVFMIQSGTWQFTWGETGDDGQVILKQGDTISIPANMFRGFENVGDEPGFMFSILGLNESGSAGHVMWAPYVFEQAKDHGLVLLEDGRLIDTSSGMNIPSNGVVMKTTSQQDVESLDRPDLNAMQHCVVSADEVSSAKQGGLSRLEGICERAIIGVANDNEGIKQAKIGWSHGFHLRDIEMQASAEIKSHRRSEEEVVIVHKGTVAVSCNNSNFTLNEGDMFTAPIDSARSYSNNGDNAVKLWVIRRGNAPEKATFI